MQAFILVVGIIIAAGALFTAVYDVLYRYNSSNTTNLNAATVNYTGQTSWSIWGSSKNCNETTTLNFDNGTYMVYFQGQGGYDNGWYTGCGAGCVAFYKADGTVGRPNNMIVQIGVGGGSGAMTGLGKTIVTTNFALPVNYSGMHDAMAAGAGGGGDVHNDISVYASAYYEYLNIVDGTFAGWEGGEQTYVCSRIGTRWDWPYPGLPATQSHNGLPGSPNGSNSCGGGAGYYDGGRGLGTNAASFGGGGSCTPWCYPVVASDIQYGPKFVSGEHAGQRLRGSGVGGYVRFWKLDPTVRPTGDFDDRGNGGDGVAVLLNTNSVGAWTPRSSFLDILGQDNDWGLRVGWVYSVSEDGKSWQGVGPEWLFFQLCQDVVDGGL